jgi:hypothetical protein
MKVPDALGLLFDWPSRHAIQIALPLAMVASAMLHVAGLAAFGLKDQPRLPQPRAATVGFLPAAGDAGRPLGARAAGLDPSLFSPMASEHPALAALPGVAYTASFDNWKPDFAAIPPHKPVEPGPALQTRAWHPEPSPRRALQPPSAKTAVILSGDLASFEAPPDASYQRSGRTDVMPASFLVGAGPDGKLIHVLPMRSSGDATLDRSALAVLLTGRAAPASDPLRWGFVEFRWGTDVHLRGQP